MDVFQEAVLALLFCLQWLQVKVGRSHLCLQAKLEFVWTGGRQWANSACCNYYMSAFVELVGIWCAEFHMSWNFTQYLNGVGAPSTPPATSLFLPLSPSLYSWMLHMSRLATPTFQKQSQYFLFLFRNWCVSRDVRAVFKEGQTFPSAAHHPTWPIEFKYKCSFIKKAMMTIISWHGNRKKRMNKQSQLSISSFIKSPKWFAYI